MYRYRTTNAFDSRGKERGGGGGEMSTKQRIYYVLLRPKTDFVVYGRSCRARQLSRGTCVTGKSAERKRRECKRTINL